MAAKKKFISITRELSLIRETHRVVLQWLCLGGGRVIESSVGFDREALADCAGALSREDASWSNESAGLRIQSDGESLELSFGSRARGMPDRTLQLNADEAKTFKAAVIDFAE